MKFKQKMINEINDVNQMKMSAAADEKWDEMWYHGGDEIEMPEWSSVKPLMVAVLSHRRKPVSGDFGLKSRIPGRSRNDGMRLY